MLLLAVLVIVISVLLFSLLFIYLFRVYKRLQKRHLKPLPPPDSLPPGLEQHQELAFVLAHGVEAYNELRRQRQQREQAQARAAAVGRLGSSGNDDTASIQSSHPSITTAAAVEPPPAYSADPVDGDIGYGWRMIGQAGVFGTPTMTGYTSASAPVQTSTSFHPLDSTTLLLPPVYIYQASTARSTVQAALLTTDNPPSVTVNVTNQNTSATTHTGSGASSTPRNNRRRSVVSGILARGVRNNQRTMSTSSASSTSSTISAAGASSPQSTNVNAVTVAPLTLSSSVEALPSVILEIPGLNDAATAPTSAPISLSPSADEVVQVTDR
ncbi:hypothetical protein BGX28_010121 [Mortierella sp. GBA30]|nr:hypothetical protein BGX28_010121 [Mortierella sp. GBA30]